VRSCVCAGGGGGGVLVSLRSSRAILALYVGTHTKYLVDRDSSWGRWPQPGSPGGRCRTAGWACIRHCSAGSHASGSHRTWHSIHMRSPTHPAHTQCRAHTCGLIHLTFTRPRHRRVSRTLSPTCSCMQGMIGVGDIEHASPDTGPATVQGRWTYVSRARQCSCHADTCLGSYKHTSSCTRWRHWGAHSPPRRLRGNR
jgi:hypothetical protein